MRIKRTAHLGMVWLQGGEAYLQALASGCQGDAIIPLVGFSFNKMAAFNRRTIDLGSQGQERP